jgi:hypothetical protein
MHHGQAVEFFRTTRDRVDPLVQQLPLLSEPWNEFNHLLNKVYATYNRPRSYELTPDITRLERNRDKEYLLIVHAVKNILVSSTLEDEVAHASKLMHILRQHPRLERAESEAESAEISALLSQLDEPEMKDHIDALHLTRHIETFKALTTEFQRKYLERAQIRYERMKEGNATQHIRETSKALTKFSTAVETLSEMLVDADKLNILEEIAQVMNANIHQNTAIVNRHQAILKKRKSL